VPQRPRHWLAPALLALLGLAIHLACGGRYGFFRDELYFVACGERLAWGYVDQPPAVALLARLAWRLSGEGASVLRFRLPALACHAASILLGAALARRLGGGPFAMALAAAAVLAAPVQLAQGHLLTMNVLELALWSGVWLAALEAAAGRPRAWLLAGLLLGLSLLAKFSAGLLALALLAGLLATRARAELRRGVLWGGVAVAALVALPAAWWQAAHGLPFLELVRNGAAYKNAALSPGALLFGVVLDQGLAGFGLALVGLWGLAARGDGPGGGPPTRFLGVAVAALLVALPLLGAKPYYLAPLFPPLFAAGAVVAERRLRLLDRPALGTALVALPLVLAAPALPLAIPIVPADAAAGWMASLGVAPPRLERMAYPDLPQHLADQVGWPERVAAVAALWRQVPETDRGRAVLFTTNYGRAAALELLGRGAGLPPVVSGHNQYFLWGLPFEPEVVLAVGGREEDHATAFGEVRLLGRTPAIPHGMPYESEIPVYLLRRPLRPVTELFRAARHVE